MIQGVLGTALGLLAGYLAEQTGVAEAEWHHRAEHQEHLISPQQANALSAQLGHPIYDPHGDIIPRAGGDLAADTGQPLTATPLEQPVLPDRPMSMLA